MEEAAGQEAVSQITESSHFRYFPDVDGSGYLMPSQCPQGVFHFPSKVE